MKKSLLLLVFFAVGISGCNKGEDFLPYDQQLKQDLATIDQYLLANGITAVSDTGNFRYVVNKVGTGVKPTLTSRTFFKQVARKLDGTQLTFPTDTTGYGGIVNQQVPGLQLGLPLMTKGSVYTFFFPSGLLYGNNQTADGSISPNTNMIIQVTLLDDDVLRAADVAKIDDYLDTVSNVIKDPSGLRLVIHKPGSGSHPGVNSNVVFDYSGSLLSTPNVAFETGNGVSLTLSTLIDGFQIGLPYIAPPDGKVTLYIPSTLAYGYAGAKNSSTGAYIIPPKAIVIYEVTLTGD